MSDLGHKQTDEELKRIENVITKEYKQAAQDVEDKMLKHFDDFNAKDIMMRKKVDSGAITEAQYNQWRIGQMATGERWISLRDSLTQTLVNADKVATQIIQGNSIKAYGDNMNYGTYEIEHGSKINTGFNLYDSGTVINLMKDNPKIVPMPRLDIPKDEQWNRQHLSSAVLQGILQGESIPKIADRLQNVAFMGRNSAIRNARTYTTAAENKGRIDSYERAENMGIKTNKKWIATLDDRTRAEHRHLDGMSVPYDSKFESDGYEIAFPGDPSAEPEMFYNCRCTLVADIVGYPYNDERKDDKLGDMTYEEWKHAKDKSEKEEENKPTSNIIFADNVKDETKDLILKLEEQYNTRLGNVTIGSEKSAGDVDISGYTMRLSSEKPHIILHEFAHTMASSNADKYGLTNDAEFWKEIDKVKREYRKDVGQDTTRWISSYEHGTNDKDEFLAEAFAMAKMKEMGIEIPDRYGDDFTYADRVLEITDKYFGKEVGSEESQEEVKPESEAKSEQKEWIKHIEFTPAETIEDAEQYAKDNFIQSGGFYNLTGKTISYKGIDLDMANRINERLTDIYGNFDVNKLSSLESYGKTNKKVYKDHEQAGMLTTNFGNIGINREICGSQKLMDKYNADAERDFQFVMDNIESLTGAKRALAETYKEAGRSLVGDQLEDFITHEMGHHISYMADVNKELSNISRQGDWKNYARSLSGYANATFGEYIAESFNAYYRGETDALQPEIIDVFEKLRKE